jgi:hypothetical protein
MAKPLHPDDRQYLIDSIEKKAGSLLSVPWNEVSDLDLCKLDSALEKKPYGEFTEAVLPQLVDSKLAKASKGSKGVIEKLTAEHMELKSLVTNMLGWMVGNATQDPRIQVVDNVSKDRGEHMMSDIFGLDIRKEPK